MKLHELKNKLAEIELPERVVLDSVQTVTDPKKMIDSHVKILEANSGKSRYKPYYDRLLCLYQRLNGQGNENARSEQLPS